MDYPLLAAVDTPLFITRPSGQFCGAALIMPDQGSPRRTVSTRPDCCPRRSPHLRPRRPLGATTDSVLGNTYDLRGNDGTTVRVKDLRVHPNGAATRTGYCCGG
ncbi:hypothetical protein OH799_10265 [Nocardia sp. NBC_00881]|uniref:hypothetical protein n=1 Tax=Nocardia sp. NBC_00881 TaxID=2975995 RepID=UPI0038655FC8|nr:hypothetical protein OH799_10265 [Nocardia sp. NBC_00881]